MTAENPGEERPRLEILPKPREGVTDEIFEELLINRDAFVENAFGNLKIENPHLASTLRHCFSSPKREDSLDFALAYYEIFSRTAREQDKRLLLVTDDTIKRSSHEQLEAYDQGDEQSIDIYLSFKTKQRDEITVEAGLNPELGKYWLILRLYEGSHLAAGAITASGIELVFEPTHTLRGMMLEQQKANLFKRSFPKS